MPKLFIEALAILGATGAGVVIFFVIYFIIAAATALLYGNEIIKVGGLWGLYGGIYFGWILGLLVALRAGKFVRKTVQNKFIHNVANKQM